ncbi:nucleoside hydrolase [Sphaerisporangium sp. NPDC088356]|uniref:nucleoside hydrolase n=1 Tax=Sphaerisporangium sp. NPDC088356 TaxID=3154871 RepID=UPI0034499479
MLLVDTDPGLDDAHALAMACARQTVVGVTTVAGNVDLPIATENACRLLGVLAPEVPVFRGAAAPLGGERLRATHIHGEDGLLGATIPDGAQVSPADEPAAVAIARLAREHRGKLTVVALGPLTNIALALRLDPDLAGNLASIVVMGGAIRAEGNASPVGEFNVTADPVAADIVLGEMAAVTLVAWETTRTAPFTPEEWAVMAKSGTPGARVLAALDDARVRARPDSVERPRSTADPIAMAVALDPACVRRSARHAVLVGTAPGLAAGLTAVDWTGSRPDRPDVHIPLELDRDRVHELLTL